MEYYFLDMSKLSITDEITRIFEKNNNVGALIRTSYFRTENQILKKLSDIKLLKTTLCLQKDCFKSQILGTEIDLQIFDACNEYESSPARTLDIIREKASMVANSLGRHCIDTFISQNISLSQDIFNSTHANSNFYKHHSTIISAWINGLNRAGMCCSIEIATDHFNSQQQVETFERLKFQISAIVAKNQTLTLPSNYNGKIIKVVSTPSELKTSNSMTALRAILGKRPTKKAYESIEI